jgi:multidrug efflux pump subunit AcrB
MLAVAFKSYTQPFIVMLIIPFSVIGAILFHIVRGDTLSIMSVFGILALVGVVVNDSLVLVDYVNKRRLDGYSLLRAVSKAGVVRFRPIFLTSLTTIGGLTPLLLEKSRLFLVPMMYLIFEDIGNSVRRVYHWWRKP